MVQMALQEVTGDGALGGKEEEGRGSVVVNGTGRSREAEEEGEGARRRSAEAEAEEEAEARADSSGSESSASSHDCSAHPDSLAVAQELELSRLSLSHLNSKIKELERRLCWEAEEAAKAALLEQRAAQQERELQLSRQEHDLDLRTLAALRKDTDAKLESLKKQCEQANKEKEAMVMRYVVSEKELIDQKKDKEALEKKLKEALKENETVMGKLKLVSSEKARMGQLLDNKSTDLSVASKEIERLKEEMNSRDIKIKWIQNKVKTEMDLHKECPSKIEGLSQKVLQLEEELEAAKKERENYSKEMIEYQQNKSFELQLKEEQAKLILERHEHTEREAKLKALQAKNQVLIEENNNLSMQNWEQERFEKEEKLRTAREEVRYYSGAAAGLQARIADLESLAGQLQQAREKAEATSSEMERLMKSNEELASDMAGCRSREAEMLAFTQKLTTKNVQLQSEFSAVEAKAAHLEREQEIAEEAVDSLRARVAQLERELRGEQARRAEESRLLARKVAEKATRVEELEASLDDHRGEISVLRNKHNSTLKEMQRELHQYRKKVEQLESVSAGSGSDSLCQGSRTSSLGSLNENPTLQQIPPPLQVDVSPQALVDRIVRLQHEIARQKERIEFLEEHTGQLVSELQKKTRLLQSYILREEAGALTSRSMDSNRSLLQNWSKLKTMAEVTRHGGIMASLYASKPSDDTMTLELSLEINHKLQAILEDTLLKNITLKENIDTLGDEIARLSRQKV